MKKTIIMFLVAGLVSSGTMLISCKQFLDESPDKKLIIVSGLSDLQALLDDHLVMQYTDAPIGEKSCDDFFLTDAEQLTLPVEEQRLYTWQTDNIFAERNNSWGNLYQQVYTTNVVLEEADRMEDQISDKKELAHVRAQAIFQRSKCFLNAVGIWSLAYDPATASKDMGIPLVKTTDFNVVPTRASVQETYDEIISSLENILPALPDKAVHPIRASKAATYGMLARAYLYIGNYEKALLNADNCLKIQSSLMNYNTLSTTAALPMGLVNEEVIYEGRMTSGGIITQAKAFIAPELYASYHNNDLRKVLFFRSSGANYIFKGYYARTVAPFNGIATDEMFLTRAECYARTGQTAKAIADINTLLRTRYKTGTYTDIPVGTAEEALKLIKQERRKELTFRGLRWMDIKRWNKEGDNIILKRSSQGVDYVLQPNSLQYAIALPYMVVSLSGMPQNPR